MTSRCVLLLLLVACVTPRVPARPHPPAPDRYALAADPDPVQRVRAADELAFDPSPAAVRMLLTLLVRDVDPTVRGAAARAIVERRDPNLEGMLARSATEDPDPAVRATSSAARRRLHVWSKTPGRAAGLSLLCPGCGHLYLGNYRDGALYTTTTAALVTGTVLSLRDQRFALDGTAESARVPIGISLAATAQNLWFYSIFDAYRDARVARGDLGYTRAITRESLGDLASAPFRPGVLKSPWVWAGVPLALAAAVGVSYLAARDELATTRTIFDVDKVNVLGKNFSRGGGFLAGSGYYAALFEPVGIGEEALFRGVIQTELEERFGPVIGLVGASAIFGAVHVFNFLQDPADAVIALPVITVLGTGLGLAYQRTGYKLSTSVAMHFWYDFLLSTIAFAADPDHQPFVVSFAQPL